MTRPKFTISRNRPRSPAPAPVQQVLPPPPAPSNRVPKCGKCGVFVIDPVLHAEWHEREEDDRLWRSKIHRHVMALLDATGLRAPARGNSIPRNGDTQ